MINKKRFLDLILLVISLFIFLLPAVIIYSLLFFFGEGSPIFWSKRVGKDNIIFLMPKFRTMGISTPILATHLLGNPDKQYIFLGKFLRVTSLDEIPQLLCIYKGTMSFVGPRPALFNQVELIDLRGKFRISELMPGITGWAQINGRDNLSTDEKVAYDLEYLNKKSFKFDLYILFLTILNVFTLKNVSH